MAVPIRPRLPRAGNPPRGKRPQRARRTVPAKHMRRDEDGEVSGAAEGATSDALASDLGEPARLSSFNRFGTGSGRGNPRKRIIVSPYYWNLPISVPVHAGLRKKTE